LPQRLRGRAQVAGFAEGYFNSSFGDRQRVAFGMIGRRVGADNFDCGEQLLLRQRESCLEEVSASGGRAAGSRLCGSASTFS